MEGGEKILILGVGNPILTDDAAGLRVVELLREKLSPGKGVDFKETSAAGLTFLDEIEGYNRLILVDSIKTEGGKPGQIYRLILKDFESHIFPAPPHGINLPTALALGEKLGFKMPRQIEIYAIEVEDNVTFGERCTEKVEEAIPRAAEMILQTLKGWEMEVD